MTQVSLVSYNVHQWIGMDQRYSPERIFEVLHELNADLVGLQEVSLGRNGGKSLRTEVLEKNMNMEVVCGTTLCRDGDDFGNVLLSKFPVIQTRRHNLSVKAREPRGALDVDLLVNGTPVKIVVTHLGLRAFERSLQIEMLLESVSVNDTVCTVLMGDFNVWSPVSMARRHLQKRFGNAPFFRTYPSRFPLFALDRILVTPGHVLTQTTVHRSRTAKVASDHLPVTALINVV
jgi:endonuclease/exonuclease/phosphatase family metal-dependent hydrolase